jgi:nitroreductase/Pyruvate/2-oxoacid:ferredoxin oxidoreductase delta subunit
MTQKLNTIIDQSKCIGCTSCIKVCPFKIISMQDKKAVLSSGRCLACGHCAAVCPVDAINVGDIADESSHFSTFQVDKKWLAQGEFDMVLLARLMGSRRSCRNFKDKAVDRTILEDLVKFGITAPSGSNAQLWTFTLLPTRKAVLALREHVHNFYENLIKMTESQYPSPEYVAVIENMLSAWTNKKVDIMFHAAPAAIIVGSKQGANCAAEDALLATQNMLLAAHGMGLGTCLIGFAAVTMKQDITIKRTLGIPDDETVYSVIVLGYPNETYRLIAGRKPYTQRYFEG